MKIVKRLIPLIAIFAALALMSSCSSSSTQVVATGDAAVLESQPTRILSLSPTATEILFAIGAGDQVIAVDDQSNYPPEAPTSDISGFTPNLEAILALEPDLVVHSYLPEDIEQGLSNVGIPSLTQYAAASIDDTYQQITQLGEATGASAGAQSTVREMQQRIDEIMASIDVPDGSSLTFYHELDPTYFSVTSSTFIGQVYAMLGLTNIADEAEGAGSGYPQLSEEYILSQNPDLIFLADTKCCAQDIETVAERNGWNALSAVSCFTMGAKSCGVLRSNRHCCRANDSIRNSWLIIRRNNSRKPLPN